MDWERQTFTVSKATFDDKPNIQQLVNVLSPGRSNDTSSSTSGGSSGNSSTIGIAVGVTLGVVLIIAIIVFCLLRRRRKQRRLARYEREQEKKGDSSNGNEQFAKPELHTGIENSVFEAPGTEPSNLDSTPITPRFLGTGELFGSKVTKHSELPTSDYLTVPRELHSNHIVAPVELEGSTPGHAELEGTSSGGTPLVAGQDTPGVSPSRHSDIRSDVSPLRSSENSPYFGARGGRNARTSSVEASPLSLPMEHPSPMSPSSEGPPLRRPHEPRRMDTMDSLPSLPSPLPREDGYQRFPTDRVDEGDETK